MLRFVGECNVLADFCVPLHPADVLHFMSNTLRGRNIEQHVYLYEDRQGRLLALILLHSARFGGYDLVIHPAFRYRALESQLIAWSEQTQRQRISAAGSKATHIGSDVLDQDGERREALLAEGYAAEPAPFMMVTMRSLLEPLPQKKLAEGFTIRRVQGEHEADALGEVHSSAFGSNWPPGEYIKVMRTPGFQMGNELVVVAPDGRLAAFLIYWSDPVSKCGLFEPVGCRPEFQRHGLTKALMVEGMEQLVAEGMMMAMVIHAADNPAAAALYRSVGFALKYTVIEYRKAINTNREAQ
jgi:ribosomal protein S18 acetylase RimI-like enzyme